MADGSVVKLQQTSAFQAVQYGKEPLYLWAKAGDPAVRRWFTSYATGLAMRMSDDEIKDRLSKMGGWDRDGDTLTHEFEFANFVGSVDFVNRITPVAEEMNHHPDLAISWSTVTVTITTHSEGGLTNNDFELARKVDAAA